MSRRASYREGLSFGALSFFTVALLSVVSGIVVARIYGISVIGQFALAVATVNAVRVLSSAKERPALIRELTVLEPRAPRVTGLFVAVFVFSVALTTVVGVIATVITYFAFRGPVGHPELFTPALVSMVGYLTVINAGENLNPVLTSFRAGRALYWIRLHEAVVLFGASVALGFLWGTVWGLVGALIVSATTSLIHRLVVARRYMRFLVAPREIREGFRTLPAMIKFGLKIAPGNLADGVSNESATWILGSVSSLAAVGAWNRSWMLTKQFFVLNQRITEMLFPTLVQRRSGADAQGFTRAFVDSMRYSAVSLLLPAAVGGGASAGILGLYGPGFAQGATALAILLLVPAVYAISQIQRSLLYSVDRPVATSMTALLRLAITLGLGAALTARLGPTGAAIALVAGFGVALVYVARIAAPYLASSMRLVWPAREMAALLVAYATGFASSRAVLSALPDVVGLPAALGIGSIAYAAVFVALGGVNERDRERLRSVRGLVARRLARRRGQRTVAPDAVRAPPER